MRDDDDARKPDPLLYLGGQVNALLAFVAALVQSHPDRPGLLAAFRRTAQLQESQTLNAAVSDDYLRGQQETLAGIEKLFEALAKADKR